MNIPHKNPQDLDMTVQKHTGNNVRYAGYTLRQWTLLFSIIFFIFTAIFTTLSILGLLKSEYGWKLIKADIAEEEHKSYAHSLSNENEISANEKKLCQSIQSELVITCVFYLCSWTGILNLITVACLVYGVVKRCHAYILPWVVVSFTTFGMALFTLLIVHSDDVANIKGINLVVGLTATTTFVAMWNTIFSYFQSLVKTDCQKDAMATAIKAYGGYTHTLKTVPETDGKQTI